jgi:hypothetical protein
MLVYFGMGIKTPSKGLIEKRCNTHETDEQPKNNFSHHSKLSYVKRRTKVNSPSLSVFSLHFVD